MDVQGNVADDSWKQWLDSWETPSYLAEFESDDLLIATVGFAALLC